MTLYDRLYRAGACWGALFQVRALESRGLSAQDAWFEIQNESWLAWVLWRSRDPGDRVDLLGAAASLLGRHAQRGVRGWFPAQEAAARALLQALGEPQDPDMIRTVRATLHATARGLPDVPGARDREAHNVSITALRLSRLHLALLEHDGSEDLAVIAGNLLTGLAWLDPDPTEALAEIRRWSPAPPRALRSRYGS